MNAINTYQDKILIVDDSSDNLRLLEDTLSSAGYRMRLANDGELVLRSTGIHQPALKYTRRRQHPEIESAIKSNQQG
jgi:CheY-like chemotaxis protein